MKNTIKLLAMACAATVMLTACSNENATPIVDDSSVPASSAGASSTASKPQIDATSGMQQTDDENGALYTVIYDYNNLMGDVGNIMTVTGYTDDRGNEELRTSCVVVADTYDGVLVEGVAEQAFQNRKYLKSVVLPDSIKVIGAFAFRYCKSLESVTMPANLIRIDDNAFQYCENLERIVLPDSLEPINRATFDGCKKIQVTYKGQTYDYAHIDDLYKAVNGE